MEVPYLAGVFHVSAYAKAFVVVSDVDDADSLGGIFGQPLHVEAGGNLALGGGFRPYREVFLYDRVDAFLYVTNLLFGQRLWKMEVQLGLLPFHMSGKGSPAMENPFHRTIEQMFGTMGGRVFLLVVRIKDRRLCHDYWYFSFRNWMQASKVGKVWSGLITSGMKWVFCNM